MGVASWLEVLLFGGVNCGHNRINTMKIASIVNRFPCRSQTFITNQITGLIDRGHDVQVYANRRENIPGPPMCFKEYDLDSRTFYFVDGMRWMPENKLLRLMRTCPLLAESWKNGKLEFMQLFNFSRFGKKAASLELFYKGMALAKYILPDIVHCHFGPNGKIAVALKEVGVIKGKIITTFYGYDLSDIIRAEGADAYEVLFDKGDLFVAISEKMRDELVRLGCSKKKIIVHRLGIDLGCFTFSPKTVKNVTSVRLLTVGRFVEKKGIEYAIRAVAEILKRYPYIHYQIVGDGELWDQFKHLITHLNVEEHIQLLGWRTPEEVAKLMEETNVFLAPSVTSENGDQEGTPTVIIEALARGLPVLSTRHSGIHELVQDTESGFLVPERDTSALAERIEYLVRHPEKWDRMGRAGRAWVEEHHDINRLNDQLVKIFERVLNGEVVGDETPNVQAETPCRQRAIPMVP